jgi:hypothetical protein
MFVVVPSNVDYLIGDLRLHIGDTEKTRFSDSVVRAALVGSVKMLQRRWKNRYLVFVESFLVDPPEDYTVPSGYVYAALPNGYGIIPSGLKDNDVFRNPAHTFVDPSTSVISQEDEFAVILGAAIILRKSYLSSSAESFQIWSDGEYSFSNVSKAKALSELAAADEIELNNLFRRRLAVAVRGAFGDNPARID